VVRLKQKQGDIIKNVIKFVFFFAFTLEVFIPLLIFLNFFLLILVGGNVKMFSRVLIFDVILDMNILYFTLAIRKTRICIF
jgi:hypothetical protein